MESAAFTGHANAGSDTKTRTRTTVFHSFIEASLNYTVRNRHTYTPALSRESNCSSDTTTHPAKTAPTTTYPDRTRLKQAEIHGRWHSRRRLCENLPRPTRIALPSTEDPQLSLI